jgi:hypothetical protein
MPTPYKENITAYNLGTQEAEAGELCAWGLSQKKKKKTNGKKKERKKRRRKETLGHWEKVAPVAF